MTAEALEQTSRDFFAAMNARDFDALMHTFAEDAVSYEPVGTPPNAGREQLRAFYEGLAAAFRSLQITVDSLIAVDGATAIKWTGRGVAQDGSSLTFEGFDVHEFDADGNIQTLKGYFDPAPMMAALGQ